MKMKEFKPSHFNWRCAGDVAVITLKGSERKNPITFESYAELRDTFRELAAADDIKGLFEFTRMTGDLVKAMHACPQPVIAAVDGVCVGAGAMIALFCDIRLGTPQAKTAFLFTRVGLAGCDMGACAMLPRVIGHGRASELLFSGRTMSAEEGERWGFFNRLVDADKLDAEALAFAQKLAQGPVFAHMMTKTMLGQEWSMSIDQAIEAEAQAQAICMQTADFRRAYEAFIAKGTPRFAGN
jgi:enoyl-CoA hydratase/carnithine racemase